jgi:UDP-2-acetamido-3-amino-2,3-dideoxy-glucuronate N-acetyltransferase
VIDPDVVFGERVTVFDAAMVNLFGCEIGDDTFIGPFVEITRGARIGRRCKIESHSFICTAVEIEDDVFVGHGVMFTNDLYPKNQRRVEFLPTHVKTSASLGTNATIIAGVTIGAHAIVGAGAVVTRDVPDLSIVMGNPARIRRQFDSLDALLSYMTGRQPLRS